MDVSKSVNLMKYCFNLPKTELHAHLNGSIRKSTLFELLGEDDREELSKLYSNQMSFENAFKVFAIASNILKDLNVVRRITREMIDDWAKVNCIYLEIRTSLKSIGGKTKEDYLQAVLEEIRAGNKSSNIETRLIISLNRVAPIEDLYDTLQVYENFRDTELKQLIVGMDYSGYEVDEKHNLNDVIPIFEKFREYGLGITLHAGESENYQMPDFSIFRPDRISHTYYFKNEEYLEVMRYRIPIEICPTGGYSIKNLSSYKDITFNCYHNRTVNDTYGNEFNYNLYSFNTDDTMLFTTDLSQEYFEVASNFNLETHEIKEIVYNAIDFIFEKDEQVRNRLRKQISSY